MAKRIMKPGTMISPLPAVLISCGDMEHSNVFTAAWTGILSSNPPRAYVSIRPERHSYGIISEKKEFVINLASSKMAKALDYCGVKSGRDEDKFLSCSLKKIDSIEVACPTIKQSPLSLECRVFKIVPMGSHDMFMADIVSVSADEHLFDKQGRFELEKSDLISYIHGQYFSQGKLLGNFGWSVRKKKKKNNKSK
ncbi:MAG: flavin reductase family protein [Ruminococcaceae bacterium]|nr:flavin reductase family protein [Oscillospiraceae bacterium]